MHKTNRRHILVTVTTNAREDRVEDVVGLDPTQRLLRVWVTVAPARGRANDAVRDLVAHHLNVAPSLVSIRRGQRGRRKLLEILSA